MRNSIKLILPIFLLILVSCEEGFEPKTDFQEDYVLFGLINGEETLHSIVLSKSYNVDSFNPLDNTTDPDISGAIVTIEVNNTIYQLKDTLVDRTDNSRYSGKQKIYTVNNLQLKSGDDVKIRAELPNGKVLNSNSQVPFYSLFFFGGDDIYPLPNGETGDVFFSWGLNGTRQDLVYSARFFINYEKEINGKIEKFSKEIPSGYSENTELFPKASNLPTVNYSNPGIDRAIKAIEPNSSLRNNIKILNGEVEISILDKNMGSYLTSIETVSDGFTIQIFESNYSNVDGGIGVFGSYLIRKKEILIEKEYLQNLGYKTLD